MCPAFIITLKSDNFPTLFKQFNREVVAFCEEPSSKPMSEDEPLLLDDEGNELISVLEDSTTSDYVSLT